MRAAALLQTSSSPTLTVSVVSRRLRCLCESHCISLSSFSLASCRLLGQESIRACMHGLVGTVLRDDLCEQTNQRHKQPMKMGKTQAGGGRRAGVGTVGGRAAGHKVVWTE